jgi:ParB family chromosome partitioning protein
MATTHAPRRRPTPATTPATTRNTTRRPDAHAATAVLPGTEHLGPIERGQYADWVHLDQIIENPDNPRTGPGRGEADRHAAADGITELANSIREQGLLEPPVVAPRPSSAVHPSGRPEFLLIAGERRTRALRLLAQTLDETGEPVHDGRLLVIVRPDLADPAASTAAALVENLQRVDLTPLQEARAFLSLRDVHGWSQGSIARAIGRNPGHVSKRLVLLDAVPLLTELIEAGTVPLDVAGDLARLDPELQQRAARDVARRAATPIQARAQAMADATDATARTQALRSLDAAGLAYEELTAAALPAPSAHGPVPVDFPGYTHVLTAHERPAGLGALACETRYVTRTRTHRVVTDPGANAYAGFDPAFVTGRWCTDPASHLPATVTATGTEPSTERSADRDQPSVRTRLFSEGSGYQPFTAPTSPTSTPAPRPTHEREGERALTAATMARTAFLRRLLTDRIPPHATAVIAGHALLTTALAPELAGIPDDPGAEQGAARLAVQLLGPTQAPLDASPTAHRRALLAATLGPQASTERRTRFALALTLARAEDHVLTATRAHALHPLNPTAAGLDAITHLLAAETLSALTAWGHTLTPLEQTVLDTAPKATAALAVVPLALGVAAPAPQPTEQLEQLTPPAPSPAPVPAALTRAGRLRLPTQSEAARLTRTELARLLTRADVPTPATATRAELRAALEDLRARQDATPMTR